MTEATATAAMMATSVVMRGASVGSGSMSPLGDGDGSTAKYAVSYEVP